MNITRKPNYVFYSKMKIIFKTFLKEINKILHSYKNEE